jgi:hypothetical protein
MIRSMDRQQWIGNRAQQSPRGRLQAVASVVEIVTTLVMVEVWEIAAAPPRATNLCVGGSGRKMRKGKAK